MRRAAVIGVQVVAAVLVGLAIREVWVSTHDGNPPGAPARAVDVATRIEPDVVLFGATVVATADVIADATVVDSGSIRLQTDFSPYEVDGRPVVERNLDGATAHVVFRYLLRCLREGCEPARTRGVARFEGLVRYRFTGAPGTGRDVVEWRPLVVVSRVTAADVEAIRWRASETSLPTVTTRLGPRTAAALLLLGALVLAACAGWLGRRLWRVPPPADEAVPRDERRPLERALELARGAFGNGTGEPARRKALELVARELDNVGLGELGDEARALAWSPRPSSADEVERLAARVDEALARERIGVA